MKKLNLSVTYSIITPESAEYGESAENGFIIELNELPLGECISELFKTRTSLCGGITDIYAQLEYNGLSVTVANDMEFETGAYETRTLHVKGITESSAKRLAKLLGVKAN